MKIMQLGGWEIVWWHGCAHLTMSPHFLRVISEKHYLPSINYLFWTRRLPLTFHYLGGWRKSLGAKVGARQLSEKSKHPSAGFDFL